EASGKTTLALMAAAQAQRAGLAVTYVDAEHAVDPAYAERLGVDWGSVLLSQPDSGEQALDVACAVAESGEPGLVVVDSVAALAPRAELDGEMGDSHVGQQARMMGKACRKLTAISHKSRVCVIFINQLRETIGGPPSAYNKRTTGGHALKFAASIRAEVKRGEPIKDRDRTIGAIHTVVIRKN